ncbi:MAG: ferritin-like domain-containing protein, partial [Proteobacteria bacterium]|nr:ferritin-like domain-containing protein [Pseudomonadota bacterium]
DLTITRVGTIAGAGRMSLVDAAPFDAHALLQIALANEVSVAELAAWWVATTPELDVKLAFARQAGDEAGHFQLVADRLRALDFDVEGFAPPAANPLFRYLAELTTTVERVAAGLFALEAIAAAVNENFMAFCRARGDDETVRLYETIIQPEERAHHAIGRALLAKYATTPTLQLTARTVIERVFDIATTTRAAAATRLGVACFPGC